MQLTWTLDASARLGQDTVHLRVAEAASRSKAASVNGVLNAQGWTRPLAYHLRCESHARRLVWVLISKRQPHGEDASLPGCVVRTEDGAAPYKNIFFSKWARTNSLGRILLHCL